MTERVNMKAVVRHLPANTASHGHRACWACLTRHWPTDVSHFCDPICRIIPVVSQMITIKCSKIMAGEVQLKGNPVGTAVLEWYRCAIYGYQKQFTRNGSLSKHTVVR